MKIDVLLAATTVEVIQMPTPGTVAGAFWRDVFYIVAAALGLAIILLVWALFIRKKKRERSSSRLTYLTDEPVSDTSGKRRRRKRMRRPHRGRNPTLAETGGLPPPKNLGTQAKPEESR